MVPSSGAAIAWWCVGVCVASLWAVRVVQALIGFRSLARLEEEPWISVARERAAATWPKLVVVVPARNEAESVERCLRTLLDTTYPRLRVVAVDDRSSDATGEIMEKLKREHSLGAALEVLHINELPKDEDWLGKTHAMWRGAASSAAHDAQWVLFTDGDVFFHPEALTRAIAYAESERADHVVVFPTMMLETMGETMMIALFQTLFIFEHRAWRVSDPQARDFIGVGAFNLVRRSAYEGIGTYEGLKMAVLDDMRLGERIKRAGFAQRVAYGRDLVRLRWAKGAMGVVRGLTKNAFALADFTWWRALGLCLGVAFVLLTPYAGAVFAPGWAKAPFVLSIAVIWAMYAGMSRETEIAPGYMVTHPVAAGLFVYTIVRSMAVTMARGGVEWRGTVYPLETIRKMQQY